MEILFIILVIISAGYMFVCVTNNRPPTKLIYAIISTAVLVVSILSILYIAVNRYDGISISEISVDHISEGDMTITFEKPTLCRFTVEVYKSWSFVEDRIISIHVIGDKEVRK